MEKLDFIYKRHSVRKFKDIPIPREDIERILEAAINAPSGKNAQNWYFVVVTNKEKIEGVAHEIEKKNTFLCEKIKDEKEKAKFGKFLKFSTFFRNAPALILVYATDYPITGLNVIKEMANPEETASLLKPDPGIQNIGAAMENLLLAAAALGYGTCWMTSQNYASREITEYLGFDKEGYFLAAITPLGIPEVEPKSPERKSFKEVTSFIE